MRGFFALAFVIFVSAAISDFVDGFLARKYKVATKIGGVLDHIGDKFLVVNSLIMIIVFLQVLSVIIPAILMICRELYVSGLREFLGTQKIEMPVPKARFSLGKIKTFVQMLVIAAVFLWIWAVNADWNNEFITNDMLFSKIGEITILEFIVWFAAACSIISAIRYTMTFIRNLKKIK
jgi:CDP-diacylglycerol--glycerol-3-phosphate 3-phosphatidyltransferase